MQTENSLLAEIVHFEYIKRYKKALTIALIMGENKYLLQNIFTLLWK